MELPVVICVVTLVVFVFGFACGWCIARPSAYRGTARADVDKSPAESLCGTAVIPERVVVAESSPAKFIVQRSPSARRWPDLIAICGSGTHYHFNEKCPSFRAVALKDSISNLPTHVDNNSKQFKTNNIPHASETRHENKLDQ
jgi:hypothetical protein